MDFSRSTNVMNKDKQLVLREDLDKNKEDTKRDPNWTVEETNHLLNVVQQIHERRNRVGFKFKDSEKTEIFCLFKIKLPHANREKEKMINRLKVLQKMYKVCHELASLSGGGWDDDLHRPVAASEQEYVEMVRARGESGKFLLKNNFPWYRQIQSMVGGQAAKGVRNKPSWAEKQKEPIPCLLTEHMSLGCSEQDSSDDPDDGNINEDSNNFSKTKSTGNSGSKRKSTDDSSDMNSKGKRYKQRYRKKKEEDDQLAAAGFEIARCLEQETKWKMSKDVETDQCIRRFKEFGIVEDDHDICMRYMDIDHRRKWFLVNDRDEILKWIKRTIELQRVDPLPTSSTSVPFQQPFQPNQSAFNYAAFFPNSHPR